MTQRGQDRNRNNVRVDPAAHRPLTAQAAPPEDDGRERLQKALARAGVASRRASEDLIAASRVTVNGQRVTTLGTTIDPAHDKVAVDGKPVIVAPASQPAHEYIVLNKPEGYVSTVSDPEDRPTVLDIVRKKGFNIGAGSLNDDDARGKRRRLYPVGRLDLESEGLLLLTDDGELANRLTHPRYAVPKEYLALVIARPSRTDIDTLRNGINIQVEVADEEYEEVRTAPAEVELLPQGEEKYLDLDMPQAEIDAWRERFGNRANPPEAALLRFVITEGKKRQIRLMCDAIGHRVKRLRRVRFGNLHIEGLASGDARRLRRDEVNGLRRMVGLSTTADPVKTKPAAKAVDRARATAQRRFSNTQAGLNPKEGEHGVRRTREHRKGQNRP